MEYPQDKVLPYGKEGEKRSEVEHMFNHIAPTYDTLNHTLSLGIDRRWRKRAIACLKETRPKRILDVATGTGDFAILAARELVPDEVVGIDISDAMMAEGKEKVEKAALDATIRFKKDDCTALSFQDNDFDAVTTAFGIRNFVGLDKALGEMFRVLRDGGRLVILELSTPTRFPMKQLYKAYSKVVMPVIGQLISKDKNAYTYLPDSIRACPQGQEMQAIIRQAGFRNVTVHPLTFGICTLYVADK